MSKEAKKNYVDEMKKSFSANESVMIAQYQGLNVNELDGLAIMSDTDNSKMKAIAYYQNIYFSAE